MYRAPERPQRSPGASRPPGRFPSPPCWGFPGARSPYGGSGHRGGSPRGFSPYSPVSPVFSPGASRGYRNGSPSGFGSGNRGCRDSPGGFGSGSRSFGDSPPGFGSGSRGFRGQKRRRGDGYWRPQSFSPTGTPNFKAGPSDAPVERYFSPSMVQDPWKNLQPVTAAEAAAAKRTT